MTLHDGKIRARPDDTYPTRVEDRERWLERLEPVLWSEWSSDAPISREQAGCYERDGYLVMKDIFSAAEIEALVQSSAKLRTAGSTLPVEDVVTEPGAQEVRTIFRLDEHSEAFRRLAHDRRLAGVAQFLLGDGVYVHQSRLNYKPGLTGKEFYWHSDFETWHAEDGMPRMRAVSASLLLTDNGPLNGPLMLIPGSHRTYISCRGTTPDENHKSSLKQQEVGVPSDESLARLAQTNGIDYASGKAGTLIFFDCNTIHGSNGNITPFPRSNVFFVFNAVSNALEQPFAARKPRPSFLARRGAPEPILPVPGALA
ncbi:ectoine hydroxylase [Aquibaculum arenosum]|uniref:Ectoine hydroxylase n=1 Tax=Aquibaculum arenosum TaxID=3032591 RepID=A0ABT5YKA0_9PROT|nr:ectoine hydroxylase [Fodinicurvata sp. CAU 1616]MDF2095371.1 ectoine hydroxylase [Fodinicurvata sp. CAU 1616]